MTLKVSRVTAYFSQKLMNPYVVLKEFQPLTSWQWINSNTRHSETNKQTKNEIIRHFSDDKPKIVLINKSSHVFKFSTLCKYQNTSLLTNLYVPFLIETTFIFHKIPSVYVSCSHTKMLNSTYRLIEASLALGNQLLPENWILVLLYPKTGCMNLGKLLHFFFCEIKRLNRLRAF